MRPKNAWLKLHKPELLEQFKLSDFELHLVEQGNEARKKSSVRTEGAHVKMHSGRAVRPFAGKWAQIVA
jgi:hypothetical protein